MPERVSAGPLRSALTDVEVPPRAAAPYPVLTVDTEGTVVEANRPAEELFTPAAVGAALNQVAPTWMWDAHQQVLRGKPGVEVRAAGAVGDRRFEARPTLSGDGLVVWWLVDDTDRLLAELALDAERQRTALLAEASNLLLSSLNVERCMEVTAQLAARHLAEAAVVVAPSSIGRYPITYSDRAGALTHRSVRADPAEVPGLGEALQGFPPMPSRWIDPAAVPEWVLPDGFCGPVGAVVVTPLPGQGVPAGALILLRRPDQAVFSDTEEIFARQFAARAGAALSAAMMYARQTSITATLMAELLPPPLSSMDGAEFAGAYQASQYSDRIGGDFYDVHPAVDDDGETLVVLGDVCGKGLEAAILTGRIRNTLAALRPLAEDHQSVLDLLNRALMSAHSRFATLVLASVRRMGSQVRLRLTSAGHPPPLTVRVDGTVEVVPTQGVLLGVLPQVQANTVEIELEPGETCLLYTDGITEARSGLLGGEQFGEQRLQEALSECAGLPPEAVTERIQMLVGQWIGPARRDDMAMVAITAPRSTHLSAVNGHTRGRYTS